MDHLISISLTSRNCKNNKTVLGYILCRVSLIQNIDKCPKFQGGKGIVLNAVIKSNQEHIVEHHSGLDPTICSQRKSVLLPFFQNSISLLHLGILQTVTPQNPRLADIFGFRSNIRDLRPVKIHTIWTLAQGYCIKSGP